MYIIPPQFGRHLDGRGTEASLIQHPPGLRTQRRYGQFVGPQTQPRATLDDEVHVEKLIHVSGDSQYRNAFDKRLLTRRENRIVTL